MVSAIRTSCARLKAYLERLSEHPAFVGFARSMDLFGVLNEPMPYEHRRNGFQQDWEAIASDWEAVGDDLRKAIDTVLPERS